MYSYADYKCIRLHRYTKELQIKENTAQSAHSTTRIRLLEQDHSINAYAPITGDVAIEAPLVSQLLLQEVIRARWHTIHSVVAAHTAVKRPLLRRCLKRCHAYESTESLAVHNVSGALKKHSAPTQMKNSAQLGV